ncbi:MAG: invasion associated locus B family protein [Hyphomicrobiaceae bacterium]
MIVALCLSATASHAATVVGTYSDWTLYSNSDSAGKICFLATTPASTEPANLKRDPALLYISSWPKDGVKSEISIKLGFPAKKSPDPVAAIVGPVPASFKLFPKDDRVYVADSTQELKLLEAMKKGSKLTVQAVSERGTTVTDTYSLNGISAALQAFGSGCP